MTLQQIDTLKGEIGEYSEHMQNVVVKLSETIAKSTEERGVAEMVAALRHMQEAQFWLSYISQMLEYERKQNPASKIIAGGKK